MGLRGGGGAQSEEETVFCSKDPAWFVNIPWDKGKGGLPTGKCIRLVAIKFAKCLRQLPVYALSYPPCVYTYVLHTDVQRYSNPPARYNNGIFKYTVCSLFELAFQSVSFLLSCRSSHKHIYGNIITMHLISEILKYEPRWWDLAWKTQFFFIWVNFLHNDLYHNLLLEIYLLPNENSYAAGSTNRFFLWLLWYFFLCAYLHLCNYRACFFWIFETAV